MHYLEDYLELLEPLREIVRQKLTLMRENDLKLQVEFAQLEEDSSEFLTNYHRYQKQSSLSPTKTKLNISRLPLPNNDHSLQLTSEQSTAQQEKQSEYDKLVKRHEQLIKLTTTKTNLANESHDVVDRYYKKLENDLNNFKMELEADYSGLTEILEKRFAREDCSRTDENSTFDPSLLDLEPLFNPFDELAMSNSFSDDYTNQSTFNYLTSQSRRSSTGLTPSKSLTSLNRKQHQRLHSNLSTSSRGRKRLQSSSSTNNTVKRKPNMTHNSHSDSDDLSSNNILTNDYYNLFNDETNEDLNSSNFNGQLIGGTIDERCYCFCNEVSYGDMIACDNSTCRREWFHYSCVGIITPPKGKWFCTECVQILR